MADTEQKIATTREQMAEFRERMDEVHNQIFTLKLGEDAPVRSSRRIPRGRSFSGEVSDRLSKSTLDVVNFQEQLMVARIHFQDGVADLSLEKKDDKKAVATTK